MTITSRSTKAEILAAYESLRAQQQSQMITWPLALSTARIVTRELSLLARDVHQVGTVAAQWISKTVDELKKPVLRSV